jgi:fused signal recognition particle receptor
MGLFDKFKKGLTKTRDFLAEGIRKLTLSFGRFDEDQLDELEMLLVQADVGVACSDEIMSNLRDAIRTNQNDSEDFVLNVLKRELLRVLGPKTLLPIREDRLNVIFLVGVNGTGKTTTAGKLALRYGKEGKSVLMAAADTFRAAAIEQLAIWADRTGCDIIAHAEGGDPASVVYDAIQAAKSRGTKVLIIDTAGRLHNKKNLMDELGKMRRIIDREAPEANIQTILVIDATTGQNAILQAETFAEVAKVDSIAVTKLDGNAKGGIAVAVAYTTGYPIVLAGLGENADDLVDFDPVSFVESLVPAPGSFSATDER